MSLSQSACDARSLPWPDESIRTVVTSPPYWGQRVYGVPGEIGREKSHTDYVSALVEVGRELRRCLTRDGTLWLNLGDTFNTRTIIRPSSHQAGLGHDTASTRLTWRKARDLGLTRTSAGQGHLKDKDLMGLPHLVANALVADGWWLRADVIWSKPWCTPENAPDRPSRTHEYLFLLSKSAHYHYDKGACLEGHRSVWEIAPGVGSGKEAAIMPAELVRRCVLLTSRPGDVVADPFAGSGTTARVARSLNRIGWSNDAARYAQPARPTPEAPAGDDRTPDTPPRTDER